VRPEPTSVCIVGAGVIGLSIAWHLTRERRLDVVVLEKSGIASGASGVQPGGVRQQWSTRINCELASESVKFYESIEALLDPSLPIELQPCGYVFIADSPGELRGLEETVALQNDLGIESRVISPEELAHLVPGIVVEGMTGAAYHDRDGYFDRPQAVVEAFAAAAQLEGVEIVKGDVVDVRPRGDHWLVECSSGRTIAASDVILAGGYDMLPLATTLELDLPVAKQPRYLFLSDPIRERLLEPLVVAPSRSFAAKHLADGRVLASDLSAGVTPGTDEAVWRSNIRSVISSMLPILEYVTFPILAEGYYDITPDHQPIIGEVRDRSGLWLAVGFSGHGFMMAPAIGRRLAQAVVHRRDDPIFAAFSPERFGTTTLVAESRVV
jgi:sarcosine oxidase subunit beta